MKQVLALLGAMAMVVGALAIRANVIEGDGSELGDLLGRDRELAGSLRCASELAEVCNRLAGARTGLTVTIEPPGTTADRLTRGEVADDVWLAPLPWIAMARELASGRGTPLGDATDVLARSPLVVVATPGAVDRCGDPDSLWRCVGDEPSEVVPGIEGSGTTPGLWARAALASAFFEGPYAANDFDAVPEGRDVSFGQWLRSVIDEVRRPTFPTHLDDLLRSLPTADLAASIEAVAVPAVAGSRAEGRLQVIYPSPMTTVDVAAVAVGDAEAAEGVLRLLQDEARRELAEAGWRVPGERLADALADAPELPDDAGLPAPGVLAALRARLS